jgi:hypothetical protein
MPGNAKKPRKPKTTPEWVFPWRGRNSPYVTTILAALLVAAGFAVFMATLRVRVMVPKPMAPRKGALIHLMDDAQGRALALKAQEGGPFPSRFEPSQWEGTAALESAALSAANPSRPPYLPALRGLPEAPPVRPPGLAAGGQPVFPKRIPPESNAPDPAGMKLAPFIYPLAGITVAELPSSLPEFDGVVNSAITGSSWRFLLRLNRHGTVVESVPLEKGGGEGALELKSWLQRIRFQPAAEPPFRWISLAVSFTNQPADGTETR